MKSVKVSFQIPEIVYNQLVKGINTPISLRVDTDKKEKLLIDCLAAFADQQQDDNKIFIST